MMQESENSDHRQLTSLAAPVKQAGKCTRVKQPEPANKGPKD
jgi:hypothetical protein